MPPELTPEAAAGIREPVTLDIPGDWWDVFLYAGRLYLITLDGDVVEVDWPRLVESLVGAREDRLALELSFIDARFLYGRDWERLVRDPEIRALITDKINRVAAAELIVDSEKLHRSTINSHLQALPEAISDLDFHRNRIYTASEEGLVRTERFELSRNGGQRQWDGEALRLRANAGMLAVAAGVDGLRQSWLRSDGPLEEPREVLRGDFTGCSWLSTSIYASSHSNAGALAVFSQSRRDAARTGRRAVRRLEAALDSGTLFDAKQRAKLDEMVRREVAGAEGLREDPPAADAAPGDGIDIPEYQSRYADPPEISRRDKGFSWAGHGLICRADVDAVHIVRYSGKGDLLSRRLDDLGQLRLNGTEGVTDGDVAPFGVVVETDDDLRVITDDAVYDVGIRPVRWRTYHRATNYPNHLHVVASDRVRIISFLNEDMVNFARRRGGFMGRTGRAR
ncbi:hypothetical protein [Conexibacter sp. SYSU D00693]|uniref:hypothetical protein n=1 Tax=Conexibacter sp. SYSU D00693 TaxID=2812560 RepID=UPI00196AAB7C|nr:hypothetical protein [Conexibacter sp. SYSU D00693]